ncbi:MAG: DUF3568 family protein [Nibricoccus sp.]
MKTNQLFSRRGLFAALFIALAAVQSGCTTVIDSTTPGAVIYVRGEVQANFDRKFDAVARAANRALTELQFSKIEEKKDALVAILEARTAEDVRIYIKVERQTDTLTTVRIRAGTLGNEKLSYAIYNKIKEVL